MSGGKHLLLLAVFLHLARCQNLRVSMSPDLKQIFCGDILYLTCERADAGTVTWYHNNLTMESEKNTSMKIAVVSLKHNGSYRCENNGKKSGSFNIKVLEYDASASLALKTGQPVMRQGASVTLQLDYDSGLKDWECRVTRGLTTKRIKLKLNSDSDTSIVFQPNKLTVPETIFWCTDKKQTLRSNQQVIRTTMKDMSLEMYPLPAVVGESLTLRCLVWGTDRIESAVFYKENNVLVASEASTYEITNVKPSTEGKYKCHATYVHVASTKGDSYKKVSDIQDVFVQDSPMKAALSNKMSCSCEKCKDVKSYHFYKKDGETWKYIDSKKTMESGTYACRAVMETMRSSLSNTMTYQPESSILTAVIVVVVIMVGVLLIVAAILYKSLKKRSDTGPIYEDMPMRSQDEGGDRYEPLQMAGGKEREYDTLHTETQGRKKEGEYEGLKKEEMKEGVYHTLGVEGEAAAGGYEALKKEGMKEGVYHTLGVEGEAAAGGYEALKKEGMKGDDYQTLETGGAGGQGEQDQ